LALSAKMKDYKHRQSLFASLEFDFCRVQLKFAFRIQSNCELAIDHDVTKFKRTSYSC